MRSATNAWLDGQQVVLEKQGATTTASYTYGNTLLTRSGETMHFDGHGSLRTVTNASQGVLASGNWHAYGVSAGGTGFSATPYQYGATSRYRNDGDAGLLHIGARWFDPAIGRWISADSYLGRVVDPLTRNRYLYCKGNPVNLLDPSGLDVLQWGYRVAWVGGALLLGVVILDAFHGFLVIRAVIDWKRRFQGLPPVTWGGSRGGGPISDEDARADLEPGRPPEDFGRFHPPWIPRPAER